MDGKATEPRVAMQAGIPNLLASLWRHLSPRRRRQSALLLGLILTSTFAEMVSLGAVVPFIAALSSPKSLLRYPLLEGMLRRLGATTETDVAVALTVAFVVAAIIAGAVRVLVLWASTRLAFASGSDLSADVYRKTLYQPYAVHVSRSSSEVISGITKKVEGVVFYVLVPLLTLFSSAVQVVATTLVLLLINAAVALTAAAAFGLTYAAIAWISRRRLRRSSEQIAREQTAVIKALQEGLGGIRDVLLDGTQEAYCDIYRRADQPLRRAHSFVLFNGGSPRFLMEALGMVLIAGLAYALSRDANGLTASLPILGALAIAAQRLLPALQQGYAAWANIAASHALLRDTVELLDQPLPSTAGTAKVKPLAFERTIAFETVRFRYADDGPWVLDGLSLVIPRGSRVAFVGATGSGKSTALDVVMGLLLPSSGRLLVDGEPLDSLRLQSWQRGIAHVPQHVFLADASIAENVAFGVPRESIDMERVEQAACLAQIAEFVRSRPEGYGARVGERGVQLSGGQRQRIGIARALYKRAAVLVLDEATSSLDSETEKSVMNAIETLSRNLTVLMIAHRLSTVQSCDTIVELSHGRIVAQGSYADLLHKSSTFRRMAHLQHQP